MSDNHQLGAEPIAIVGSACRFPGDATSPAKLWELLKEPRDLLTEIRESRFNHKAFYHPDGSHHGTSNVRHSYLLSDDHRLFDAHFFGTKPIEANSMDPQQRLLLEIVYEGLESAGIPIERLQGSNTGVYVGLMTNDYADLLGRDIQNFPTYFASGTARSILSNRVSYFFDWHGPSMTIDTACSSSLIAVHQAVLSLRNGESKVAVAAGTNLLLGPEQYVAESKLKMLSPTGRSRMWDKDADGYARGDGIAAVILKRLSAALADGDQIECLIRETGINQDGRTKGITMPNPSAQADLIRETYAKAGLDLANPRDRPQYFEAHGTGTPAGDPVEAEAISDAFFGPAANYKRTSQDTPMYVGSIKTVIGHTEGTAGLAAVLKASLALQHAMIPPNLLFNELNPSVRPFYDDLLIADSAEKWPDLTSETTRRASVNSFGFGGANAHAILEAYENLLTNQLSEAGRIMLTPFNFSASTEKSLLTTLKAFAAYLKGRSNVDLHDLSWTLNCRRSTLPVRVSIFASSATELTASLDRAASSPSELTPATQTRSIKKPKLLGIFTGQGAQWARMGAELLKNSSLAADCIACLDLSLQALPEDDRPMWSLKDEILKDIGSSRIGEALFSQTLCTAVQVMLVDLLRVAGVFFTAVVGHSSGEIAAAYAAGYLSAEDAIRIAYYRGCSLQNPPDRAGAKGAMMAVGTYLEDAEELCSMPTLEGRICVAASNSSASVTLSGDSDAIEEAKEIFEDEKKFARLLKVDKAYHSHHMIPCAAPYIEAMQKCDIMIQSRSSSKTKWFSSVYSKDIDDVHDSLTDTYWSNNMINPVMFSQALSFAVAAAGPFDFVLEIGPHPALKGPALQTIQEVSGNMPPYSGMLSRGKSDIETFASALGALWISLGEDAVNFADFESKASLHTRNQRLLKGLPAYSWDHDRIYWHESRISSTFRAGNQKFHPLLGVKCPDGTDKELRWRNYLNPREIPWLMGHQVQGQMVFPAAGYISAATEMAVELYGLNSINLIDFQDVIIGQALILEENSGVEVIFTLTVTQNNSNTLVASFNCYSDANKGSSSMSLHASAQVRIFLGEPTHDALPPPSRDLNSFLELDAERFYNSVAELGYDYTSPFQALSGLSRRMDEAAGMIAVPTNDSAEAPLIIHPASLDAAIQSVILAYCFPGDGRLRNLCLPTKIDRIRINPWSCVALARPDTNVRFYSAVANCRFAELSGDVDIYSADRRYTVVQLQGLHTTPLTPLSSATDVTMFTELTWALEEPTGRKMYFADWFKEDISQSLDLERVAHFYLKKLHYSFQQTDHSGIAWHHQHLLSYATHCVSLVASGNHPFARPEWAHDTKETISEILQRQQDSIDVRSMTAVGEILPSIVRGHINLLDTWMQENMLSDVYFNALGAQSYLNEVARIAGQISNRYPHINVLEIGAGAGESTEAVLREMDTAFASYTYTDLMDSMFDIARERFDKYQARMAYKVLDIERDIAEQGFSEQSYDVLIATFSLYATRNLEATLRNVRRLLKPGGYFILMELTDPNVMRFGLTLGGLPGWWQGHQEGRVLSPCISVERWSELMSKSGLSGVDACVPHHPDLPIPFSVMVTQAVDSRISFLRNPLMQNEDVLGAESLTIIGGKTAKTATIITDIINAVGRHYGTIGVSPSFDDIIPDQIPTMGTLLSLAELDDHVFVSMTPMKLRSLQELFTQCKIILWVGYGAQGDNPFAHMFTGVQRTLVMEMNHLQIQSLNLHTLDDAKGDLIALRLLRLQATDIWSQEGKMNEILWYMEPEMTLRDGKTLIPRFRPSPERNDRYNSTKRLILKIVNGKQSAVSIQKSERGYQVLETSHPPSSFLSVDQFEIEVTDSLLRPVPITQTVKLFLVTGNDVRDGSQVVVLSETLDSRIRVPGSWVIKCGESADNAVCSMLSLYVHFLAQYIVKRVLPGKTVAVLDADFSMAAVLTQYANQRGVNLVLFTTTEGILSWPWVHIHRHMTRRDLMNKVTDSVALLFNAGGDELVMSALKEILPKDCLVENEDTVTGEPARFSSLSAMDQVFSQLQKTWTRAYNDQTPINMQKYRKLGLKGLIEGNRESLSQCLVSWDSSRLPVQIRPATKVATFAKDKTYWLVGLTGGLGLSLCKWMARQGARYIALSSRNPKIDDDWVRGIARNGCTVRVFSLDITDRDSVYNTHRRILQSMPQIGGVAQGAMVLQDTMFLDLDVSRYDKVIKPKVNGSLLLDELFPENTLDFMIFFSSMAAITGNPGQVAYNAANMFMASLAAQRRKRGLAGQAINIGAIVGNGYVTRELNMAQQSYLYRVGHSWMAEQDFQEVFAEGVLACQDGASSLAPCSGLRIDDDDSKNWVSNPMFQHLVFKSNTLVAGDKKNKAGVTVRIRLLESTSQGEVMEVLQEFFLQKLESALQADSKRLNLDSSPDELGVDSLIAVDLRSWFIKELGVDIPVLKIFNAASIRNLLDVAASLLSESLVPNLTEEGEVDAKAPMEPQTEQRKSESPISSEETPEIVPSSGGSDEIKSFHLEYLPAVGQESGTGSSHASLKGGDSGSDQSEDNSSASSLDIEEPMTSMRRVERITPMSFGQSRFWFLRLFVPDQTAFNVTPTFELIGRLRVDHFARAVKAIGQRHEALRTYFFTDDKNQHMQGIWSESSLRLEHRFVATEIEIENAAERMKNHVFDVARGEILRVQVLSSTLDHHWVIFGFHHINMDGMSFEVLWSDIETMYKGLPLIQDTLQYPDFAERQRRELDTGAWSEDLRFWRENFAEIPSAIPLLPFSLKLARPAVSSFSSHKTHFRLERSLSDDVEECCRTFKVSLFNFYFTAWQILLLRFFDVDDICVGLADGGRTDGDILQSVGLFLNSLPIKFHRQTSQSFSEALRDTRKITQDAMVHSRVPFDVLLAELNVPRSASHNPLFQVFFNYRRIQESRNFCGCVAKGSLFASGETSYDIHLDIVDFGNEGIEVYVLAQEDLYAPEHADILLRSYCNLLREFTKNPATRVSWPSLFSSDDVNAALVAGRGPELRGRWPGTILHRVDDISQAYGDHIALKEENGVEITYSQLHGRVGSIAYELLSKGFSAGTRVGVFQSPGANWICSLLAIMRTGATYVGLDKKVGMERLAMIATESEIAAVLVDTSTVSDFHLLHSRAEMLVVRTLSNIPQVTVPNMATSSQTAIVMYTSGSTGKPKGISLSHDGYLHHIQAFSHTLRLQEGKETVLHQSSYAWDMSLYQIFVCLCNGGTLVIANSSTRGDPVAIASLIASHNVTTTLATPTEYLAWIRYGSSALQHSKLITSMSGGEFLSDVVIKEFQSLRKFDLKLINAYGPAEVSLACSVGEVPYTTVRLADSGNTSWLYTLPNYSIYIVDDDLKPVPIGVPGEVVVGGAGIAQGYLEDDKTSERFLLDLHASPFFQEQGWTKAFRTGDRGRLTQDGSLVLLGRINGDNQIKLGGIRINVEEIETAILRASGDIISQCVVSPRSNTQHNEVQTYLVAFVVLAETRNPEDTNELLDRVATNLSLPQYMRPSATIPFPSLPQSASGKVDRLAVSRIPIPILGSQQSSERTFAPLEKTLRQLWQEAIPRDIVSRYLIGPASDFFHVGGSSLSLVTLQALVKDRLGVSISLHQLFEASTFQGMAHRIQNISAAAHCVPVDWDEEIESLIASSSRQLDINTQIAPHGAQAVVLTGATGFIGKEIVRQLIDDDRVQAIYCIAVRKPQLSPIFNNRKVHVYPGDLGASQLGLSDSDAASIFCRADVIIHNGADVSFMKTYQSLKLTNVASTVELVKLALPRRIPFHFISSASVTRLSGQDSFGEKSVTSYYPPVFPEDGYAAVKWVGEAYVERFNQQFALPVWIHRPSSVTGTDAPELDLMSNMMKFCREIKKIPDSGSWSGVFDFIAVQSVASQIINAVHLSGGAVADSSRVHYQHECGEIRVGKEEVQAMMETDTGHRFEVIPLNEWVDHAEDAGMSNLLAVYLRKAADGQIHLPRLLKGRDDSGHR
ncbi:hypothetical protein N7476_007704 [Penicillium atrosanguineum]|uniref:Uncharacterized protein n=1 Tax=Penicillium atrosanguineum TaxID=1132637 RepID=A0A9W9U475_9EURO|nr:hypothetical protein N7476_007704 [Penicillium atrosanguineum]